MGTRSAIDNDILLKLSYFGLLDTLSALLAENGGGGVLGAARYVVPSYIYKNSDVGDPSGVVQTFEAFLVTVEEFEPTDAEVELAAELEKEAARHLVELDPGESQLCAILVSRTLDVLLTGDKRAIAALATLGTTNATVAAINSRLACLEQLMIRVTEDLGADVVRLAVCGAKFADRAMAICFSCSSPEVETASIPEALNSYVGSVRQQSAGLLAASLW